MLTRTNLFRDARNVAQQCEVAGLDEAEIGSRACLLRECDQCLGAAGAPAHDIDAKFWTLRGKGASEGAHDV
jgi:hypothetical protein